MKKDNRVLVELIADDGTVALWGGTVAWIDGNAVTVRLDLTNQVLVVRRDQVLPD